MLKSGIYDFVICRGGTGMCFVLGFGRKRPDLKQYRISGLTLGMTHCVTSSSAKASNLVSSIQHSSLNIIMMHYSFSKYMLMTSYLDVLTRNTVKNLPS